MSTSTSRRPKSQLQLVRERCGFTRRYVAGELDMTEKQLERWEKGESPVKGLHLIALASIYGVSVQELEEAA